MNKIVVPYALSLESFALRLMPYALSIAPYALCLKLPNALKY